MQISAWIDKLTGQQRMVEDLTGRVSARCEAAVWARIKDAAPFMDPAQAKGYIRARAALILNRELAIAARGLDELTALLRDRVRRNASEAIVRQMTSAIATQHPAELRRAA